MLESVLITGASRGIGLALTKVFLTQGDRVFAACRNPGNNPELQALRQKYPGSLFGVAMEVDSDEPVKKAAKEIAAQTGQLDILFNNAGISPGPATAKLEEVDFKDCRDAFETNVLGPMRVTREFLPLLRKSKNPRVVNLTSGLASLTGKSEGGFYAYGVSKAALNMLTRTMAFEFKGEELTVVCLDPGWVKTDMGGPNAPLSTEEAASAIVKTAKGLTIQKTSQFIYHDGRELKW